MQSIAISTILICLEVMANCWDMFPRWNYASSNHESPISYVVSTTGRTSKWELNNRSGLAGEISECKYASWLVKDTSPTTD